MRMGEGSRGEVRKGWNMLFVQGCICYLRVLGVLGSVKEQGFDTASENWGLGMLFSLM